MKYNGVKELNWYEVEVDGRIIAILEESLSTTREVARIGGLMGVSVRPATPGSLIRFQAKTTIPATVLRRFEEAINLAARKSRTQWQSYSRPGEDEID